MMEKIYAFSNKAGRHTVISGKYIYLFLRTVVCSGNLAGSSDDLEFVCYDSGNDAFWYFLCWFVVGFTLGYGFFGGILTLMRR